MPKYAQFDSSAASPQPVIGWYDTDAFNYAAIPSVSNRIALTTAQWDSRFSTPFVSSGALVAAPTPTAVQLLDAAQTKQLGILNTACQAQIYAGFSSSALGAAHTYPAKDKDQVNLTASYAASFDPTNPTGWTTPFWCMDGTGVWALVQHTAAQIQQVGRDGKAAILAAITKNASLAGQVMAAGTVSAVEAIVW